MHNNKASREAIMYTTLVYVYVKPQHIDDFIVATRINHEASVNESGNRRFDVLQQEDEIGKFVLYEAFATKQDAHLHKQTDHYLNWRDSVANWMAKPRLGVVHQGLFPAE